MTASSGAGDPRVWMHVVRELLDRIDRGELKPGGIVPSVRDLSAGLGVGRGPVLMALACLGAHEIVRRGPRLRYIVAGDARGRCAEVAAEAGIPARAAPGPGRGIGRDELILAWGAGWVIDRAGWTWRAGRLDGTGEVLTAATAEALNAAIRAEVERVVAER